MTVWKVVFPLVIFATLVCCQISTEGICSRMYVRLKSDIPMKVLDGVYKLMVTNNTVHFQHTNGFANIFYDNNTNGEYINFGSGISVSYWMYGVLNPSLLSWPAIIRNKLNDPFDGLISSWYRYDPIKKKNINMPDVTFLCIENIEPRFEYKPCSTDELYFNQTVVIPTTTIKIADPSNIYFRRIVGQYIENRPVYRMVGASDIKQQYLFFRWNEWTVNSEFSSIGATLTCDANDLLPEFTSCRWRIHYKGRSYSAPTDFSLRCRGPDGLCPFILNNECTNGTCTNTTTIGSPCGQGTCYNTTQNRHICSCSPIKSGRKCDEDLPLCPFLSDNTIWPARAATYFGLRRAVGDIVAFYCNNSSSAYDTKFILAICADKSTPIWQFNDTCPEPSRMYTTKTPSTTFSTFAIPYAPSTTIENVILKPLNLNDYSWVRPTVLTFACLLQILPFCIVCCVVFWKKSSMEEEAQKRALDKRTELSNFVVLHSISEKNEEYKKEYENKEQEALDAEANVEKIKQSGTSSGNYGALFSFFCFASYWLWIIYLIGCSLGECLEHGEIFLDLIIFGAIMIPLCWIAMSIESFFSHEYQYLKNLGGVEDAFSLIDKMKEAIPFITVTAEAYHYETRTRTVTYTDANGNTQFRTETYQERVVTNFRSEDFPFAYNTDESDDTIHGVQHKGVTKIRMELLITFGDETTSNKYSEFYNDFEKRTRYLDKFVDYEEIKSIPNYTKRVATFLEKDSVPVWMNIPCYICLSLVGLTWVFRWAFKSSVTKTTFCIRKKIFSVRPVME